MTNQSLKIETILWSNDVTIVYVQASSFPEGVLAAHQQLHSKIAYSEKRRYFGISRPEQGGEIVYKAAAEVLSAQEPQQLQLPTLILKKGKYLSVIVHDYMKDLQAIGETFQYIIQQPHIDPQGYCVEWYLSDKDVQCMVRLQD